MLIHHLRVCSPCGCVDVGVFVSYYLFRLHILSFAVKIDRRSKLTADVCGGCWVASIPPSIFTGFVHSLRFAGGSVPPRRGYAVKIDRRSKFTADVWVCGLL